MLTDTGLSPETFEVPHRHRSPTDWKAWLLLTILLVCWSSGFIGMRFAVGHAPVSLILLWRNLIAGLVLLPFALLTGPRLTLQVLVVQSIIGLFAMAGYMLGFAYAIDEGVPTGVVALIADMLPLAIVLISIPLLGQVIARGEWLGMAIAVLGVLMVSAGALHAGDAPIWAYVLPILGMLSLAFVTVSQKRWPASVLPIHQTLCIQSLVSAALFLLICWRGGRIAPPLEAGFWIGVLWLIVLATFAGYGLYYFSLARLSPARVSSVLYLSPPVTMIWARAMFGEPLSLAMGLGMAVTLAGIVIVSRYQGEAHSGV